MVRTFKRLLVEAGVPTSTRLYDLRHGASKKWVTDLLGHRTTRLTLDT